MRCEYLKKLNKVPSGWRDRTYKKGRIGCTICQVAFYGLSFPDTRCMCCGAKMRLKTHAGRKHRALAGMVVV